MASPYQSNLDSIINHIYRDEKPEVPIRLKDNGASLPISYNPFTNAVEVSPSVVNAIETGREKGSLYTILHLSRGVRTLINHEIGHYYQAQTIAELIKDELVLRGKYTPKRAEILSRFGKEDISDYLRLRHFFTVYPIGKAFQKVFEKYMGGAEAGATLYALSLSKNPTSDYASSIGLTVAYLAAKGGKKMRISVKVPDNDFSSPTSAYRLEYKNWTEASLDERIDFLVDQLLKHHGSGHFGDAKFIEDASKLYYGKKKDFSDVDVNKAVEDGKLAARRLIKEMGSLGIKL